MKSKEDIMRAVAKGGDIPDDYNLVESHCFLVIRELLGMFRRGDITQEYASKMKARTFKQYEEEVHSEDFLRSMWKENLDNIKTTENDRIRLHKLLADKTDGITDQDMAKILRTCLSIIGTVFPGEFSKED